MVNSKITFSIFLFICNSFVFAQKGLLDDMLAHYPDDVMCYTHKSVRYEVKWDKGITRVFKHIEEEQLILDDEKMGNMIEESIYFNSFMKITNFKAFSVSAKGKKTKVRDYSDNPSMTSYSFYDDGKKRNFFFTNLEKGARTFLYYTIELTHPQLLNLVPLQEGMPIFNQEVILQFPDQVEMDFFTYKLPDENIVFEKSKNGKINEMKWVIKKMDKIKMEESTPSYLSLIPQIHPFIKSTTDVAGKKIKIMGTPELLYSWYTSLIEEHTIEKDVEIDLKQLADSITKDLDNELDKVRAIFQWVQKNIKYVAFEDGMGGFVPRPAKVVCDRRYGDCKDMASLITEMLSSIDIKAYQTWIGTRLIPVDYTDLGTPSVDNHMICTYFDEEGTPIFLDATDRFLQFRQSPVNSQGKHAMVGMSKDEFKLVPVPKSPPMDNVFSDSAVLYITNNQTLNGNGVINATGYFKNDEFYDIARYKVSDYDKYIKNTIFKGSNKLKIDKFEIPNKSNINEPFNIFYEFTLPNYITANKDKLYINLNTFKEVGSIIKKERVHPFEFEHKYSLNIINVLNLDETYEVNRLPQNSSGQIDEFEYEITYTQLNNQIVYKLIIKTKTLLLQPESFERWNTIFSELKTQLNESIVLIKK